VPRFLFIVTRRAPPLHDYLCHQFGLEPDVDVVMDRRTRDRRASTSDAPSGHGERRQSDRRRNVQAAEDLRAMGYTFVRVD